MKRTVKDIVLKSMLNRRLTTTELWERGRTDERIKKNDVQNMLREKLKPMLIAHINKEMPNFP